MTTKTPVFSALSEHEIMFSPMAVFLTYLFPQLFVETPLTKLETAKRQGLWLPDQLYILYHRRYALL